MPRIVGTGSRWAGSVPPAWLIHARTVAAVMPKPDRQHVQINPLSRTRVTRTLLKHSLVCAHATGT